MFGNFGPRDWRGKVKGREEMKEGGNRMGGKGKREIYLYIY